MSLGKYVICLPVFVPSLHKTIEVKHLGDIAF